MTNRLIRYDALLLRRALGDGFRGPADIALLGIVAILGFFWLRMRLSEAGPGLPQEAVWLTVLAGPAAFAWHRLARQRLAWLAEASPVAPAALRRDTRRAYLWLAHGLAAPLLLALALLLGSAAARPGAGLGLAALTYAAGAALATVWPHPRRRKAGEGLTATGAADIGGGKAAVLALVLRRQGIGPGGPVARAGQLLAGGLALTLAAGWWGQGSPEALRIALLLAPSLLLLLCAARLDPALLAFLPQAGFGPGSIALAVSALPIASFFTAGLATWLAGAGLGMLAVLALLHLGFILIAVARAWLYPGRQPRGVEFQLQLEIAGLAAIAFLLPPLALAALAWRLAMFRRHCRRLRWMQP